MRSEPFFAPKPDRRQNYRKQNRCPNDYEAGVAELAYAEKSRNGVRERSYRRDNRQVKYDYRQALYGEVNLVRDRREMHVYGV